MENYLPRNVADAIFQLDLNKKIIYVMFLLHICF
jgi:hypothetical protein